MSEQIHLLITTTVEDNPQKLVKACQELMGARLDPLTVVTSLQVQEEALKEAGIQTVQAPEISNEDAFAQLFHVAQTLNADPLQPLGVVLVVPAAKLSRINIEELRACRTIFWHDWADIAVFGRPIFEEADKNLPSHIKIVANQNHRVLYMSRGPVPYGADVMVAETGIRAYRYQALRQLAETEPSPLERTERVPLLRGLEAGLGCYLSLVTGK